MVMSGQNSMEKILKEKGDKGIMNKNKWINIIFIIAIILIFGICILRKDAHLSEALVSHPDSEVTFNTTQEVLEQTWQPNVKKLTGVKVSYFTEESFSSGIELKIYNDDYSELLVDTEIEQQFTEQSSGELEFKFPSLKVVLGERYRLQFRFVKPDGYGELKLPSGSNYAGCTIDGKACNEAVALDIEFIKNSRLFWMFAVFFPLISISLLFMVIFDRKWEETVGLSLIIEIFILYVFGLFSLLTTGISAVYLISAFCLIAAFVIIMKRRIDIRTLVSPGLFIYGILFIVILVNCHGAFYARWDEYIHWGLAAKDMFYYDSFAKHIDTTVRLVRYMPFTTLAEYLFVYLNGLYSQEIVYIAYQTMLLSAGSVLFYKKGNKKVSNVVVAVIIGILVPVIFFTDIYNSIYVDALLAILMFYVLYCYLSEEASLFNYMRIAGGLAALVLTKDMGLAIAGLVVLIMMADSIYKQISQKKWNKKMCTVLPLLLVFIFLIFFSWQFYLSLPVVQTEEVQVAEDMGDEAEADEKGRNITAETISASGLSVNGIVELIKGEAPEYRYRSLKNYLIKMFDGETFKLGNLEVPYFDMWIGLGILMVLLLIRRYWDNRSKNIFFVSIMVFAGGIIYCIFLELLYLFAFPENEALTYASHDRYLGSYLCGSVLVMLGMILWEKSDDENNKERKILLTCLLGAVLVATPMKAFALKHMDYEVTEENVYYGDELSEELRTFTRRGEKIFFVCNNTDGLEICMFKNFVSPLIETEHGCDFLGSAESIEEQKRILEKKKEQLYEEPFIWAAEEWESTLKTYDYVFVLHPYEIFSEDYGKLFADPDTIDDGTLYRINQDTGEVSLDYIGKVGVKAWRLPEY